MRTATQTRQILYLREGTPAGVKLYHLQQGNVIRMVETIGAISRDKCYNIVTLAGLQSQAQTFWT
jgi:hypothetical protein